MRKFQTILLLIICISVTFGQQKPEAVFPVFNEGFTSFKTLDTQLFNPELTGDVFQDGADRLEDLQYTDGGWGWPLNAPPTYGNILGPIAMGLAQAYHFTGDAAHLSALSDAGTFLLSKTNNFSPSDGYLAAKLDEIFGGTTYTDHVVNNFYTPLANGTYDRNGEGTLYNTTDYVNLIRTNRSGAQANLAAWDIGMGLVAASMCGASTAEWIAGLKAEIDELDGAQYYDVIGLAGALYGLAYVNEEFDPTAGEHSSASNLMDLANILASYQIELGGFAWNSQYVIPNDGNETIQETAYAILALHEVKREEFISNIIGASDYITSVQLVTGGWENYPGSGENNEITAEALWGIYTASPVYNFTQNSFHLTIQDGINSAVAGDEIQVAPGTYTEDPNINKVITIDGAGSSTTGTVINGSVTMLSGTDAANRNILKNVRLVGSSTASGSGIAVGSYITLENVHSTNFYHGLNISSGTDLIIINSQFNSNTLGAKIPSTVSYSKINITGSQFNNNEQGWYSDANSGIEPDLDDITITNTTFNENTIKGFYTERLSNAVFDGITVANSGTEPSYNFNAGVDINLKWKSYTNITIKNSTFTGCGVAGPSSHSEAPVAVTIKARDDGGTYGGNPASLDGVTLTNNLIDGPENGLRFGEFGKTNSTPTNVVVNNNDFSSSYNFDALINNSLAPVNAEENWWGTVIETEIQDLITGLGGTVDYDPWIGKAETLTVTELDPTEYDFTASGVTMIFSTLPSGGGDVTVQRYNEAPTGYPAPPAGATHAGLWLDISSTMPNYSFDVTIEVDVTGLGFDNTTAVMYFNSSTNSWVAISGGTYDAGPPETYTFTTNHFTPFSFVNTPTTAYNVYLSSTTTATSSETLYPNTDWELTSYDPDDWDFTAPIDLYIVPEVGAEFGASDIILQWDNSLFSFVGVDETGGIYDGANFLFYYNQLGNTDQVTINASRLDNNNFNISSGDFIAKLQLELLNPGYGPIDFTSLDFRHYDGSGGFQGVYMTGNNGEVKAYLGDVVDETDETTGNGLVDFDDLSFWTLSYWSGVGGTGMANYKVKYDVGPTTTNTVYGLPTVDAKIQFEDLVIFSMSYGLSGNSVYPKIKADPVEPIQMYLGEPIIAGNETLIPLHIDGEVANVRAMELQFSGQFTELIGVEKGSLLNDASDPVMLLHKVEGSTVKTDLALFGYNTEGINQSGEVLNLRFRGTADVNISSVEIRNLLNEKMNIEITGSEESIPTTFALMQNFPNPFNPSTKIKYQIPKQTMVEMHIYNSLGEKVATLVNELQEAGNYTVDLDASGFASGIYFYQIKADDFVSVKKMILMK